MEYIIVGLLFIKVHPLSQKHYNAVEPRFMTTLAQISAHLALVTMATHICQRRTFLERKWGEGHDPDLTGKFA